jgi:exopolysaccharide biosynthesis polyprenyl glycosylphosphotransferase
VTVPTSVDRGALGKVRVVTSVQSSSKSPTRTSRAVVARAAVGRASDLRRPAPPRPQWRTLRRVAPHIRAWMVVLPVDTAMLLVPLLWAPEQPKAFISTAVLTVLMSNAGGRFRARLHLSVLDDLPQLLARILVSAGVIATVIALRHDQQAVTAFLQNIAISMGLVVAGRIATTGLARWARARRIAQHPTVLVGGGPLAAEIAQILARQPRYGLRLLGCIDNNPHCAASAVTRWLGKLADLDDAVRAGHADVLMVADGDVPEPELLTAVHTPTCEPCDLLIVPRLHWFRTQAGTSDHIGSIPIMRINSPKLRGTARLIKRTIDVVVAGTALLISAPVLGVAALAVRIEGGPGIIFSQPRIGQNGQVFNCLKLRTMRPASEEDSATTWSIATDARIGPIGRLLRRTSIDELPQLWNVLKGDMTLVGPRPERPHFVDKFSLEFERYAYRHRAQVGLTGLAQVSGLRGDTSIADRARFDNYYIENWSIWLDIKILFRTIGEIFLARGR